MAIDRLAESRLRSQYAVYAFPVVPQYGPRELACIERGGVLTLTDAQKLAVDTHHRQLPRALSQSFDVDRDARSKQLSLGMRVTSFLGALALAASQRRCTIQFLNPEVRHAHRTWWLLVAPGADVDLCSVDPGFEVDLFVSCELKTMTAIWMGLETVRTAVIAGKLKLIGNKQLASSMQTWLGLSPFAKEMERVA